MKNITQVIQEKLRIGKSIKTYKYFPKTREELSEILEERLAKDKNANLNDIDVSEITDMGPDEYGIALFEEFDPHNIDISRWNVSNVENMSYMFYKCRHFNSDLSKWDVHNVKTMRGMFYHCENFNSDLSEWNVDNVRDMVCMFYTCRHFNSDLNKWDVSNVQSRTAMFDGCAYLKNKPSWYK